MVSESFGKGKSSVNVVAIAAAEGSRIGMASAKVRRDDLMSNANLNGWHANGRSFQTTIDPGAPRTINKLQTCDFLEIGIVFYKSG